MPKKQDPIRTIFTVSEAAFERGESESRVRRWCRDNEHTGLVRRLGAMFVLSEEALDAMSEDFEADLAANPDNERDDDEFEEDDDDEFDEERDEDEDDDE